MAGYTDYLNLYYKNPSTDGADTFNIQTMMNDNWDKIDAFASKAGLPDAGKGLVYIKCTDSSGNPLSGCAVQIDGSASVSSSDGYVRFSLPSGTYSALVYGPIDYGMEEKVVSVTAYDGKTSEFSVVINDVSNGAKKIIITESCVCAFSKRVVSADVFGVGAGGSGGAACRSGYNAAAGGAGGKTSTKKNINVDLLFSVSIGAGGSPVTAPAKQSYTTYYGVDGKQGGDTVVTAGNENVLTANGGKGGDAEAAQSNSAFGIATGASGGSGSGGAYSSSSVYAGSSGSNGDSGGSVIDAAGGSGQGETTCSFGEYNSNENYSSAGGSAAANSSNTIVGSSGSGAGAGAAKKGSAANASSATTPGSGGGAAAAYNGGSATSGAGADGLVIFRWEVAS